MLVDVDCKGQRVVTLNNKEKRRRKKKKEHGLEIAEFVRSLAVDGGRTHLETTAPKESRNETQELLMYECPVAGEAYSAAYLTTKAQFIKAEIPEHRLHRGQGNMEGASNAVFRRSTLYKTVDMFDFFVEHLSWYERRMRKTLSDRVARRMKAQTSHIIRQHTNQQTTKSKVIAVMPFYATPGGDAGHSQLEMRRIYLKLTIESLRPIIPSIAIAVATEFDAHFLRSNITTPIYDIMVRTDIFRPSRLGFAAVHMTQQKLLKDSRWFQFEYIFYTESDQIIHLRSLDSLIQALDQNQHFRYGSFLIPHRVMPVPRRTDLGPEHIDHADTIYGRNRKKHTVLNELARNDAKILHWTDTSFKSHSCCFDKAPCSRSRDHWHSFESFSPSSL